MRFNRQKDPVPLPPPKGLVANRGMGVLRGSSGSGRRRGSLWLPSPRGEAARLRGGGSTEGPGLLILLEDSSVLPALSRQWFSCGVCTAGTLHGCRSGTCRGPTARGALGGRRLPAWGLGVSVARHTVRHRGVCPGVDSALAVEKRSGSQAAHRLGRLGRRDSGTQVWAQFKDGEN